MIGAAIVEETNSATATEYRVCLMIDDWECKMNENGKKNVNSYLAYVWMKTTNWEGEARVFIGVPV